MLRQIAPFVPPILATSLLFYETVSSSWMLRLILFFSTVMSSLYAISHPPTSSPFFDYLSGFISIIYIMRAAEFLFVLDLRTLRRMRKQSSPTPLYSWEPMPEPFTFQRLVWVADLVTSPRAVGWEHGSQKYLPPARYRLEKRESRGRAGIRGPGVPTHWNANGNSTRFLLSQLGVLAMSWFWIDTYHYFFGKDGNHSLDIPLNWTSSPARSIVIWGMARLLPVASIWGFLNGSHALVTLVAVGLFPGKSLGAACEPWMYPPLFGSFPIILARMSLRGQLMDFHRTVTWLTFRWEI
jgi:hypothetical protein